MNRESVQRANKILADLERLNQAERQDDLLCRLGWIPERHKNELYLMVLGVVNGWLSQKRKELEEELENL